MCELTMTRPVQRLSQVTIESIEKSSRHFRVKTKLHVSNEIVIENANVYVSGKFKLQQGELLTD